MVRVALATKQNGGSNQHPIKAVMVRSYCATSTTKLDRDMVLQKLSYIPFGSDVEPLTGADIVSKWATENITTADEETRRPAVGRA